MKQLADFYTLIESTVPLRRDLVNYYLIDVAKPTRVESLKTARRRLHNTDMDDAGRLLFADDQGQQVHVQADYELTELDKDLRFFEEGEASFVTYLTELHPRFGEETKELVDFLRATAPPAAAPAPAAAAPHSFDVFITDRDGTVNNYCARYRSSIQSAYNAVYLTRFGKTFSVRPIILTSAPLQDVGIVDLTVSPEEVFLLAGSKGREYRGAGGERHSYPLAEEAQERLDQLNSRLEALLEKPENRVFGLIGSSLQKKHGETTVARQDVDESIPADESDRFKREVEGIVEEVDAGESYCRIEDTGKDLEIVLLAEGEERHFDKGDGVQFLMESLDRDLNGKNLLICGDTSSDVPMVSRALELGAQVTTVFVTSDSDLQNRVRETGARCHFVSNPDVLVSGLDLLAKGYES
ncbi:MAG: trehalose 6-phosphate synthase [Spirochaetes bacterium]|jgi:hypothetical protein|nr:trehalose 6-phosphate synthase [Spirochaetota bacterium]